MIQCTFENGNKALLRHVTVDAIVLQNNKMLLVKRAAHLTGGNKYCLPGGFLERDVTAAEGMQREIREETGHEIIDIKLFRVNTNPNRKGEDRQNVDFVFIVDVGKQLTTPESEVKKLEWFDLDALPSEDAIAFDHYGTIELFLKYRKEKFPIPYFSV